ncbi:MAG: PAS domain S-box protein [Desulfobacterales bacterium]
MVDPASFKFGTRYLADAIEKMKTDPALAYKHHSFEVEYICKDGTTLWAELTAKMVADENGKTIGIIGVSRDISQRLVAENALKKSEEKYRTLLKTPGTPSISPPWPVGL